MVPYSIYIVDDEETIRHGLTLSLESDYKVASFSRADIVIDAIKTDPPDLVLLDIGLPDINGIEALKKIKDLCPDVLVIMITAYEDTNTVVSAMKLGAYDYIVKPIQMDNLEITIRNALETIRLKKEVKTLQEKYLKENLPCFIGESKAISDVMQFVESVAKSPDTPILILGESGTGKELIAGAIHYRSPNFKGPLIIVNCASIPKDLIESELFGYEKGAFSGASTSGKKGLVEQAENGTLFLDEIGDLSLEAQAKLLRFLESGEFYRVGGSQKTNIKTRIVSATNKKIKKMIDEGLFRKDLYFRIGVITIKIPSLNKRSEDILPIAEYFLVEFSKKFGKSFTGFSPKAAGLLQSFQWQGNVRELKNQVERAALIAKGPELTIKDLGIELSGSPENLDMGAYQKGNLIPTEGVDLISILNEIEKRYVDEALHKSKNNETQAARMLHLKSTTFRYRRQRLQGNG